MESARTHVSTHRDNGRGHGVKKWIPIACVFIFAIVASPFVQAGELAPAPSPVTVAEAWQVVVEELRLRGFQEEQLPRVEDLELPVAVPARAGRKLRVSSVCWDENDRRARFRLQCSEAGVCLPFLVYVRAAERARAASCGLERPSQSPSPSWTQVHASAPVVRAGERATAVLVAAGLRMTAAVTCLDRGDRGEVIRVRGQEGHIFRARVAGPALVEALPQ
jgi:hypothetical protein